jgi:uncharacterized membrane protein YgdD (TMEM256/DUF423 family)
VEWTIWIALGSISGGIAVALGAFGAHALRERLSPENLMIFDVGARYQMYHALALLAVGLVAVKVDSVALRIAGIAFTAGSVIFSGSLYALSLTDVRTWGMVTPVGGILFLAGWGSLAVAALSR